jgi:hypothetical protein
MKSQLSLLPNLRWIITLVAGLPCVVLFTGTLYSLSGVRGGRYGENILLAIVHGFLLWLVFRLARCERIPTSIVWLTLALGCLGPLAAGHVMGYGELKSFAYKLVQEDVSDRYPEEWKTFGKEELFPRWIGSVTGTEGGGIVGYFHAQAAIGWEGWEGRYRPYVVRTGIWFWSAWFWHLIFFTVSGILAFLAARKFVPATSTGKPEKKTVKPISVELDRLAQVEPKEGSGPEDLAKRAAWIEHDDQRNIQISYHYEPRTAFPALIDFFVFNVRQNLSHRDKKNIETDVRNYLERICVMKDISRSELVRFISSYAWSNIAGRVPKVPQNLKSAVLCRDEPSIKQVIWETDKGYWEVMVWA